MPSLVAVGNKQIGVYFAWFAVLVLLPVTSVPPTSRVCVLPCPMLRVRSIRNCGITT